MKKSAFIILFLILFAVGCSKSKSSDKSVVCDAPYIRHGSDCCLDKNSNNICDNDEGAQSSSSAKVSVDASVEAAMAKQKIIINSHELTEAELAQFTKTYGTVYPGNFWYDPVSGLAGHVGMGTEYRLNPGLNFGELKKDASNGNTGLFLNGRELTEQEVQFLEKTLRVQRQPGEYSLDGQGNFASPVYGAIGNIYQSSSKSSGSNSWSTKTGFYGGSSGGCSYVSIPGPTGRTESTVTTSGCG